MSGAACGKHPTRRRMDRDKASNIRTAHQPLVSRVRPQTGAEH